MLRLIVMRHAKSAWNTDAPTDHARPLNKRGRRDAPRMAEHLANIGWVPERVLSSDSQRTRETWARMSSEFDDHIEVQFTGLLYHGGMGAMQRVLEPLPPDITTAMVLGHNPGLEYAVEWLCGFDVRMTTANAALLLNEAPSWSQAVSTPGSWQLEDLLRPKEI
jgi:phosphohistidine phosphatase